MPHEGTLYMPYNTKLRHKMQHSCMQLRPLLCGCGPVLLLNNESFRHVSHSLRMSSKSVPLNSGNSHPSFNFVTVRSIVYNHWLCFLDDSTPDSCVRIGRDCG